jgi:hypothetical protein
MTVPGSSSAQPLPSHIEEEDDFFLATPLRYMQYPILHLKSDNDESGSNSTYEAPAIHWEDVAIWDKFLETDEIATTIKDPRWQNVLINRFSDSERRKLRLDAPEAGGNLNEHTFELLWHDIVTNLNLIHKMCAANVQKTTDPVRILIGNGSCAKKMTSLPYREYNVKQAPAKNTKKPDYAGYKYIPGSHQYIKGGPEEVDNRIVGDAKLFRKIRRSMFPPDGSEFDAANVTEIMKVLKQIHDYMDRHEARYGYLVNDEELIFFRRRGTGWGHMDISPAVRHDVDGIDPTCKTLTSKLVLFYFHIIVANDESKWKLDSCRRCINRKHIPPRKARGDTGINVRKPEYKE